MIDAKEIEKEIKERVKARVNELLEDQDIALLIANNIETVISERIPSIIANHINGLIQKGKLDKELDTKYQAKLNTVLEQELKFKVANALSGINLPHEVGKHILVQISDKLNTATVPEKIFNHKNINWDGFKLSANNITEGIVKNFTSTGIQDASNQIELTIVDNVVVVENNFISRSAEIKENLVAENATINNLQIINKLVFSETINKQFTSMITDNITRELSIRKIDIATNPIYLNGKPVLTDNALGANIVNSNLRKLGRLIDLNVTGVAQFNDTLLITDNGKIGINTSEPEGALTIWDDDSELTIKRHKKKTMYIGTMRDTDLSFGVDNDVKMSIRKDGTIEMRHLEIGSVRISVSNTIPVNTGNPGELVLMTDAKEDEPWAYRCVGGGRWQAIK